jgi:hypothetical protein
MANEIYRGYDIIFDDSTLLYQIIDKGKVVAQFKVIDNAYDWVDRKKREQAKSAFEG